MWIHRWKVCLQQHRFYVFHLLLVANLLMLYLSLVTYNTTILFIFFVFRLLLSRVLIFPGASIAGIGATRIPKVHVVLQVPGAIIFNPSCMSYTLKLISLVPLLHQNMTQLLFCISLTPSKKYYHNKQTRKFWIVELCWHFFLSLLLSNK